MFCKNCGNKLPEGAMFCGNCGFNIVTNEKHGTDIGGTVFSDTGSELKQRGNEFAHEIGNIAKEETGKGKRPKAFGSVIFVVILAVIGIVVAFNILTKVVEVVHKGTSAQGNESVINVDLRTLLNEIESNPVRAEQLYKNKMIRTSGRVGIINSDPLFVTIDYGNEWIMPVYVYFNRSESSKIANIRVGQTITVRGTYDRGVANAIRRAVLE